MKIPITTLLLALSFYLLQAQETPPLATDFTVTTSDGVQRKLYADYLNQGKSVVLYLFFTTCPLCNDIAPLLEPFYQEWGGGSAQVEFLMLSILRTDSNFDVGRYKDIKEFTFPAIGDDGGASPAIQPFTNGNYGPYVGTPLFIVIAPDGKVQYNPRGDSYEATVDSIDQALRRTGAVKPGIPFQITGNVKAPDGQAMEGVLPEVRGIIASIAATGSDGNFDFTAPLVARNIYGVRFSKEGKSTNGVSTYDIVRIQRHLLGIQPFSSPYELLAADVDRSGSINLADVIHMRKLVLSIEPELPSGRSWIFVNGNYTFSDPADPFYEAYFGEATTFAITTRGEIPELSVIAIKLGDVDFNAK